MLISLFFLNTYASTTSLCGGSCHALINSQPLMADYLSLLRNAVTGSLYDEVIECKAENWEYRAQYDHVKRMFGNDWPVVGHTMVGHARLLNIQEAISSVVDAGIAGHFVELGVWRGGASIYARLTLNALREYTRKVLVFDAFEFLPVSVGTYSKHNEFLRVTAHTVEHNFEKYNATNAVEFHKGLFNATTPGVARRMRVSGERIAVLRIDGNFYKSYEDAMYDLYPLVSIGGIVIFDDVMSHAPVMRFWKDFQKDYALTETLNRIDVHSAWFRKARGVTLDPARKRPHR
jgi:hypothetical protein